MYEGLATIRETHAKLREKTRNRGHQPSSSASFHTAFVSRQSSVSGGRGKGKTRLKGRSVQQKKLVTRRFDCNRFRHWSGDPIRPAKDTCDAQAHVTSCTLQETVHVYPESFVTSSISVEQELRGASACDTCCNRTVAGQEWMLTISHKTNVFKELKARSPPSSKTHSCSQVFTVESAQALEAQREVVTHEAAANFHRRDCTSLGDANSGI